MLTRPPDVADSDVAAALLSGWGIVADSITYAAVGFGSHHWTVTAGTDLWFLSVDDLEWCRQSNTESQADSRARLDAALRTAAALAHSGLDFVVAPTPTLAAGLLETIHDRFVLAVYRHVEGQSGAWGAYASREERLAVVARLVSVHASDAAFDIALRDDLWVPARDALAHALTELEQRWSSGPFAESARQLLADHQAALRAAIETYDELAEKIAARPDAMVITHGEPHRGNVIMTDQGPCLVDWDTALLAPPERDLWALIDEDATVRAAYERRSGRVLDDDALDLYRLWWDLCEVCLYTADFRRPHADTADTQHAWTNLQRYLDRLRRR